jgi:hypothetical protein
MHKILHSFFFFKLHASNFSCIGVGLVTLMLRLYILTYKLTLQILLKHGCLPFSLDNLETLTIRRSTRISGHQVQALSSLFAGTTKLNHLIMSAMDLILPNPHNSASDISVSVFSDYFSNSPFVTLAHLIHANVTCFKWSPT